MVGGGRKVVAASTTSEFALKIEIFFCLIIKSNAFKKFTYKFGVTKIKIDRARQPPYHTRVKGVTIA